MITLTIIAFGFAIWHWAYEGTMAPFFQRFLDYKYQALIDKLDWEIANQKWASEADAKQVRIYLAAGKSLSKIITVQMIKSMNKLVTPEERRRRHKTFIALKDRHAEANYMIKKTEKYVLLGLLVNHGGWLPLALTAGALPLLFFTLYVLCGYLTHKIVNVFGTLTDNIDNAISVASNPSKYKNLVSEERLIYS